jgi:hypothetical protein
MPARPPAQSQVRSSSDSGRKIRARAAGLHAPARARHVGRDRAHADRPARQARGPRHPQIAGAVGGSSERARAGLRCWEGCNGRLYVEGAGSAVCHDPLEPNQSGSNPTPASSARDVATHALVERSLRRRTIWPARYGGTGPLGIRGIIVQRLSRLHTAARGVRPPLCRRRLRPSSRSISIKSEGELPTPRRARP